MIIWQIGACTCRVHALLRKEWLPVKLKYLNIIFALVIMVLACVFFIYADSFKILPGQADIGPKAYPRAVCVCLVILSVLLIISELKKKDDSVIQLFNLKFFIGLATAILYLVFFKKLGFVICSVIAIFVMEILLLNEPLKKAWPLVVSVAVIVPVLMQLVFGVFLKVPVPAGLLSFIF